MNDMLEKFAVDVVREFPLLAQVIDKAKSGALSEQEAMVQLLRVLSENPEIGQRFQDFVRQNLPERGEPLTHNGLVFHKPKGLPQLNPLVEAALIERAQFDDDIPEYRTGDKPAGVRPAVPVQTDARNPVTLGAMLKSASEQVAQKIELQEPARRDLIAQVALGDTEALLRLEEAKVTQDLVLDGKSDIMDVAEYRRGQVPAPVVVQMPTGSGLLSMTVQEQKQSAWQFLSTTQGRRSALSTITEILKDKLSKEGFSVSVRPFTPGAEERVVASHQWTVNLAGPGSVQPAFSLIDMAAMALAHNLMTQTQPESLILEVTTADALDVRKVGWAARLLVEGSTVRSLP